MDNRTRALMSTAGGAADKIYVEDVFSTYLYTGNGSTQTITNGIDMSGKGGLVWLKARTSVFGHGLWDTERGSASGNSKRLVSNSNLSQTTSNEDWITFNNNGFTANRDNSGQLFTQNAETYASWTFRKAAKFFDVVTWTGNGVIGRTISHSLGSVPGTIIIKRTNAAANWVVYHRSLGNEAYLLLNSTDPVATGSNIWNSTTPTSTEFTISNAALVNGNGDSYVAYLFAHDAGGFGDSGNDNVISCGSFTTNGSGAATVSLGWEPQFGIIKSIDTGSWIIQDSIRGIPVDGIGAFLAANASSAEGVFNGPYYLLPNSTGFRTELSSNTTYIYIAIRRGPMKTPTDATKVFTSITKTAASGQINTSDFPVDLSVDEGRSTNYGAAWFDRLRGQGPYLLSSSTNAEGNQNPTYYVGFDSNTGVFNKNYGGLGGGTYVNWLFRRAPGFFDVVAYTGTGANRTVAHNLGVVPELMIVKARQTNNNNWYVYNAFLGATKYLSLNTTDAETSGGGFPWNDTSPTSSVFTINSNNEVNESSYRFIAYLFATCPGVSKVGSYTAGGGSNAISVDCGFTNGARFVLIKRTDSTGDWYVWDTARGIVSGNDPYLLLNSTAAEVASEDYIDPYPAGFEISSSAPPALRGSSFTPGTFIYLAIA